MSFPRSVLHARTFYAAMIACGGCSGAAASGSVGSNAGSGTTEGLDTDAEPAGLLPSCLGGGPGLSDCGADKESCCASLVVTGGTFYRTYPDSDNCITANADPATVSSFRLDKYDVTVGRFRHPNELKPRLVHGRGDLPGYFNYSTWTEAAGTQENLPINCVNWYEAYAFCIWDGGGFLPSEAA